jgi:subtilase family serine protease
MRRPRLVTAVTTALAFAATGLAATGLATTRLATTGLAASGASGSRTAGQLLISPGAISPVRQALSYLPTTAQCLAKYKIDCYSADQIETAYGMPRLFRRGITGKGQTIIVAEGFISPRMDSDLRVFDRASHLPPPPSLKVIQPNGKVPPYNPKNLNRVGWALESTFDVQYAHAMAPGANILIVESGDPEIAEGPGEFIKMERAEEYAVNHHMGDVITQSWGDTEEAFPTAQSLLRLRGAYIDAARNHITVVTGSGDQGVTNYTKNYDYYLHPALAWPGDDPLITSVGGSELHLNAAGGHTSPDTVWNDTYNAAAQKAIFHVKPPVPTAGGGGRSVIFARPRYQNGVATLAGPHRAVPDISMSAACDGAADYYHTFAGWPKGWALFCGTSESGPLMAGVVALADQVAGHPLGLINPAIYTMYAEHLPGLVDITRGDNTVTFRQGGKMHTVRGFSARRGYDLVSGVGTIYAPDFVPELARLAG